MNRRTRALVLLSSAITALSACGTDLTEVPTSSIAPENFYRNAGDALAAVNAAYAAFHTRVSSLGIHPNDYYGRHYWMLVEYPTETMTLRLSASNERTQADIYNITPSHPYIEGVWRAAYHAINRANAVIDNVPGIDMDAALRDRIVAEAKFLRSYHYFNLVRLFGGVPLHLGETRSLDGLDKPRASLEETYQAIFADLTSAADVLPEGYSAPDVGRATSGAARALLAKAYLQYGAMGGGAAAYQQAENWARQVVSSNTYSLLPSYAAVFDMENENNAEIIFDIQNTRVPGLGGHLCDQLAPRNNDFPYCDSRNPSFGAEWPFFYSYHPDDSRLAATWLVSYTTTKGEAVVWDSTQAGVDRYGHNGPVPVKYMDLQPGAQDGAEEPNFILLRYADVLLSLAEAINENAGPTAEAYTLVDQVRARAGVPALPTGLSQSEFKDALFLERRYEFAMEAHGHFDSQRHWDWARTRIETHASPESRAFWNRPRLSGGTWTRNSSVPKVTLTLQDHHRLYPIPQSAIDVNPKITQNPGY